MPQFFEDSFEIYRRYNRLSEGVDVLIKYMSLERAEKFADQMNQAEVFVVLGNAQINIAKDYLTAQQPMQVSQLIGKALRSYIRAKDGNNYRTCI